MKCARCDLTKYTYNSITDANMSGSYNYAEPSASGMYKYQPQPQQQPPSYHAGTAASTGLPNQVPTMVMIPQPCITWVPAYYHHNPYSPIEQVNVTKPPPWLQKNQHPERSAARAIQEVRPTQVVNPTQLIHGNLGQYYLPQNIPSTVYSRPVVVVQRRPNNSRMERPTQDGGRRDTQKRPAEISNVNPVANVVNSVTTTTNSVTVSKNNIMPSNLYQINTVPMVRTDTTQSDKVMRTDTTWYAKRPKLTSPPNKMVRDKNALQIETPPHSHAQNTVMLSHVKKSVTAIKHIPCPPNMSRQNMMNVNLAQTTSKTTNTISGSNFKLSPPKTDEVLVTKALRPQLENIMKSHQAEKQVSNSNDVFKCITKVSKAEETCDSSLSPRKTLSMLAKPLDIDPVQGGQIVNPIIDYNTKNHNLKSEINSIQIKSSLQTLTEPVYFEKNNLIPNNQQRKETEERGNGEVTKDLTIISNEKKKNDTKASQNCKLSYDGNIKLEDALKIICPIKKIHKCNEQNISERSEEISVINKSSETNYSLKHLHSVVHSINGNDKSSSTSKKRNGSCYENNNKDKQEYNNVKGVHHSNKTNDSAEEKYITNYKNHNKTFDQDGSTTSNNISNFIDLNQSGAHVSNPSEIQQNYSHEENTSSIAFESPDISLNKIDHVHKENDANNILVKKYVGSIPELTPAEKQKKISHDLHEKNISSTQIVSPDSSLIGTGHLHKEKEGSSSTPTPKDIQENYSHEKNMRSTAIKTPNCLMDETGHQQKENNGYSILTKLPIMESKDIIDEHDNAVNTDSEKENICIDLTNRSIAELLRKKSQGMETVKDDDNEKSLNVIDDAERKIITKSQKIITHVIGGFVIQESNVPFQVRSPLGEHNKSKKIKGSSNFNAKNDTNNVKSIRKVKTGQEKNYESQSTHTKQNDISECDVVEEKGSVDENDASPKIKIIDDSDRSKQNSSNVNNSSIGNNVMHGDFTEISQNLTSDKKINWTDENYLQKSDKSFSDVGKIRPVKNLYTYSWEMLEQHLRNSWCDCFDALRAEEIDGVALTLAIEEQLIDVGVHEDHARALRTFVDQCRELSDLNSFARCMTQFQI